MEEKRDLNDLISTASRTGLATWEAFAKQFLPLQSRRYELKRAPPIIYDHRALHFQQFYRKHHYLTKHYPLIGWVTPLHEDLVFVEKLFEELIKTISSQEALELATAEVLAKVLAYRELPPQSTIKIPQVINGVAKLTPFRIDKRFDLWQEMTSFGLISEEKGVSPILLFRGTDFSLTSKSSRISVISNFDPKGPGLAIYEHSRRVIKNWLDSICDKEKPIAMGYSLGGALTAYAFLFDGPSFHQTRHSYIFNHPGLSEKMLERWNQTYPNPPKNLKIYISDGDVVSKYGFLFGETFCVKHKTVPAPILAHTLPLFFKGKTFVRVVNIEKENKSPSRKKYFKIHKYTSHLFFNLGFKLFFPFSN